MALDMTDPKLIAYLKNAAAVEATQDLSQDLRAQVVVLSAAFLLLAVIFVALRLYARYKQQAQYGDDDWLIIVALLFLAVNFGVTVAAVVVGHLGLHSGALTLEQAISLGKLMVVAELFYVTNVNLVKLSLLAMYYRIFPLRSMAIGCFVLAAVTMAWNVSCLGLVATQCIPFEKNWFPWKAGKCIDLRTFFLAVSIPNISTDVAILTLPLPHVWRLHTDRRQKMSLSFIFLLGSLVVFASVYRFNVYLKFHPEDIPYTLAMGAALNIVEISSGIVSACMPALGPLVRGFLSRILPSKARSNGSGPNPNIVTIGGGNHRDRKNDFLARQKRSQYPIDPESQFSTSELELVTSEDAMWQDRQCENEDQSIRVTETVTQEREIGRVDDEIPLQTLWHPKIVDRRELEWQMGKRGVL